MSVMSENLKNLLIFTGDGKGKSTAAFGMAVRAVGHQQRVLVIQFLKQDESVGEIVGLKKLGIQVIQTGRGFVPAPDHQDYAEHRLAAQNGWALASKALNSEKYDLVILDELCGAVAKGLLDEDVVLKTLAESAPLNIVLTGRGATEGMIDLADTVSEINSCKHAMAQGIPARKGVEF